MAVRTSVDIPERLHEALRERAAESGTSMRPLIIRALEETYSNKRKGTYITGPFAKRKGKLRPAFPKDENPSDLVFSGRQHHYQAFIPS